MSTPHTTDTERRCRWWMSPGSDDSDDGTREHPVLLEGPTRSAKALGKRRASVSPSPTSSYALPKPKRRRSSSVPLTRQRPIEIDVDHDVPRHGPSLHQPIDLTTESDDDDSVAHQLTRRHRDHSSDESSEDDEALRLVDAAKERHAAALGPVEVVDLTNETSDIDPRLLSSSPVAGPSRASEAAGTAPQYFSQMSCPICMTPPSPLVVTRCGHAFCGACLHASLIGQTSGEPGTATYRQGSIDHGTCPVCRTLLLGGWGKAIRGASFKVGPVRPAPPRTSTISL